MHKEDQKKNQPLYMYVLTGSEMRLYQMCTILLRCTHFKVTDFKITLFSRKHFKVVSTIKQKLHVY